MCTSISPPCPAPSSFAPGRGGSLRQRRNALTHALCAALPGPLSLASMDSLKFPQPRSRAIVHHARFQQPTPSQADHSTEAAAAASSPHVARHKREIWQRTIDEHALNQSVDVIIPTIHTGNSAATTSGAFDPLRYFAVPAAVAAASSSSRPTPSLSGLFSCTATVPWRVLLSDAFLVRYIHSGRLWAFSLRPAADHANTVQITPPGLLRLSLDTDSFEALGIDAPAAHSEFAVLSTGNIASKPNVRERVVTIDLAEHARAIQLHQSKAAATATATSAPGPSKVDKRLERLRWALSRTPPVELMMLYLDAAGSCASIDFGVGSESGVSDFRRVECGATLESFGGEHATGFVVPNLTSLSSMLPPLPSEADASAAAPAAAAAGSTQDHKKQRTDAVSSAPSASAPVIAASVVPPPHVTSIAPAGFPSSRLSGLNAQDLASDLSNYLGLLALGPRIAGELLADPNNNLRRTGPSNIFQQNPLCPYLTFDHGATDASSVTKIEDEEEDFLSLSKSADKKRKRKGAEGASGAAGAASVSSVVTASPASAQVLTYSGGLIPPSFIQHLLARCRTLLASQSSTGGGGGSRIPWLALSVRGFDSAIVSWRDKQHQVWGAGAAAGGSGGGGENHYTIVIMPESATRSHEQQYLITMMLGELDRTH